MSESNPELQLANEFVQETACHIFLTGKAGTGKTTFLHELKNNCDKRMIVTAPTGVASINAGGVTIHSFFQMPFGPFIPGSEHNRQHKFNREKINLIKSLDLLVIDEISMVRADLLDGVDAVLRRYRRSNKAFGGVQLLLIGDLHQLSPVVKNEDWELLGQYYQSPYFFSSRALAETELLSLELKHIYRQADQRFIQLLNSVRENRLSKEILEQLNERFKENNLQAANEAEGYITLCTHNAKADKINDTRLRAISSNSLWFDAKIDGDFPEHSYPTLPSLELKVGAQVMFIKNDSSFEKRFFNGKIGQISKVSGDKIFVRCKEDKEEIEVEPSTWENIDYQLDQETMEVSENKIGEFVQYPLKLAWAITIHKSQGLTFDHAIIDAEEAFAHGQVYVALSRCRSLEGMILSSPLSNKAVKTDSTVLQFSRRGKKNQPTAQKLTEAKIRYQQSLLLDCFDYNRLQTLLRRLGSLLTNNENLLQLEGCGNFTQLQQEVTEHLCVVGYKFQQQLKGLFDTEILPSTNDVILERLRKASDYFQQQMNNQLLKIVPILQPETDNKDIRKQANRIIKQLQEEVAVKFAAAKSLENEFSVPAYLRALAKAEMIERPKSPPPVQITYTEADIEHPELYKNLKRWRSATAKRESIAPFQVLHQKTLIQIAVNLPVTQSELLGIKGIGEKLASRYGAEIIQQIVEYRNKNDIKEVQLALPQDAPPLTSKQSKSKNTREATLELFLEGLSLEEIAKKRSLSLQTINKHLAHLIATGEVDLTNLVSAKKQQAIEKYFDNTQSRKLRDAKEALGKDYSYGEIQFVLASLEFNSI